MTTWPLLNRNKVLDSKVHVPVESFVSLENETVKNLAEKVSNMHSPLTVLIRALLLLFSSWTIGMPFLCTIEYQRDRFK